MRLGGILAGMKVTAGEDGIRARNEECCTFFWFRVQVFRRGGDGDGTLRFTSRDQRCCLVMLDLLLSLLSGSCCWDSNAAFVWSLLMSQENSHWGKNEAGNLSLLLSEPLCCFLIAVLQSYFQWFSASGCASFSDSNSQKDFFLMLPQAFYFNFQYQWKPTAVHSCFYNCLQYLNHIMRYWIASLQAFQLIATLLFV